jgi:DNA polymerase V
VVARLHVMAGKLCWPGSTQLGLFDPPAGQAEAVAKLKHEVNAKHGRFILRSGATLFLREIYKDEAYSYEICDVREKMCF